MAGGPARATALRHVGYVAAARFESLDGLRCLSIVPVVWHHSTSHPLPDLLGRGPLGVHLFFAISGFLITTLLLRERRAAGKISLSRFFARRALRIFPLYYAVLAGYVVRALWFMPAAPLRDHFLGNVPYFATYTANWFVDFDVPHPVVFGFSWSLSTEEQFYLLWPLVLCASRRTSFPIAAALALTVLDFVAERGHLDVVLGRGTALRIVTSISEPICFGALLACLLDEPRPRGAITRWLGRRHSATVALGALVVLVCMDGAPLVAVHLAMVALVGAVCVRPDHGLRYVLEARPVRAVGEVSYGVYLFHVAVITAVRAVLPGSASASHIFLLALPLSVGAAVLSFRYFERPFLAARDRFRHSDEGAPARDLQLPTRAA